MVEAARARRGTLAFIPPRYGPEVVGGAEAVIAETAHALAARGWDVEILTTCAVDHFTWANATPAGVTTDGDVTVRRFPTEVASSTPDRDRIGEQILLGEPVSIEEQQLWMNDGLRVPELWHHLLDHGHTYRAVICAPYMFWTTFACGQVVADRTILMPCLHDEAPAYLPLFQPLVNGARGIWFLSEPERDLADRIFRLPARATVTGAAVYPPAPPRDDALDGLLQTDRPFVLYAGRREWGKGWSELLEAFEQAVLRGCGLDLVTVGVGDPGIPDTLADRVHDLGFVTDEQRNAAMAAAVGYVQPSAMESFSRTVLEAWQAGTLVVANRASEVVRWHVERSGAGLLYRDGDQLVEALLQIEAHPASVAAIAAHGAAYVAEHYEPDVVFDRMESSLFDWTHEP